jgi:subtilase family serine protease
MFRLVHKSVLATMAGVAAAGMLLASSPVTAFASNATGSSVRRACAPSADANVMSCFVLVRTDRTARPASQFRFGTPTGYGYGPSQLQSAYLLPSSTAGAGESVAVVDAYDDPNAVSDFNTYRSSWGLPACNSTTGAGCLTKVNQNGKANHFPSPSGSTGWATEESLDVDMVAAICPLCHVYLVEANGPSVKSLGTGVDSAVTVLGVNFVSNSYGGSQSSSDPSFDSAYYNHAGSAIVASAGDSGFGVSYPAASQFVVSVGGTSLSQASNARGWTETVWGSAGGGEGTGSGCSRYEAKPTWQTHPACSHRIDNDVSAVAAPNTGVAVYDTYDQGGWFEVGGTSVSSPIIASVYALAGTPTAGTYPASYLYAHSGDFNDVTVGANGTCSKAFLCQAEKGYDGPTGLGTPIGTAGFIG